MPIDANGNVGWTGNGELPSAIFSQAKNMFFYSNIVEFNQECNQLLIMLKSAKFGAPGLVNFVSAVAYHLCPSLPAALTQPGASTLADLSI